METPDFQGTHLWSRLVWAKDNLPKQQPQYCIAWEDPEDLEAPMKVTTPDPNWLAAALNGGVLPEVDRYHEITFGGFFGNDTEPTVTATGIHREREIAEWARQEPNRSYRIIDYSPVHASKPAPAMTEEQALEYIVQKDLPQRVWGERHNRQMFRIVPRSCIPVDRTHRNAWRLNNFEQEAA